MDIEICNISKSYENHKILDSFTATFKEGETSCIMGESGSGKTTLLNILMGLIKKDSGDIYGLNNKKIAAVFQEDRLCENLSAMANVKLVCGNMYTTKEYIEAFNDVGLHNCEYKAVRDLSGGMKRRVAILRAVMSKPDVLFMDEPFKGLDDETYIDVVNYVLNNKNKSTIIMVSHDLRDLKSMKAIQYIIKKM